MLPKILAAYKNNNDFIGCEITGQEQTLTREHNQERGAWYVSQEGKESIQFSQYKTGGTMRIILISEDIFKALCKRVQDQDVDKMHVYSLSHWCAEMREGKYSFSVDFEMGKRWKCSWSQCESVDQYTCKHALYVEKLIPIAAVIPSGERKIAYGSI